MSRKGEKRMHGKAEKQKWENRRKEWMEKAEKRMHRKSIERRNQCVKEKPNHTGVEQETAGSSNHVFLDSDNPL